MLVVVYFGKTYGLRTFTQDMKFQHRELQSHPIAWLSDAHVVHRSN